MKKNDKGFVLAEAIVVAVFVLGMFTYLAMNVFPLITKYDKAINYNEPNETYLVNVLFDELIAATDIKDINSSIRGLYSFSSKYYCTKTSDNTNCEANETGDFCLDNSPCTNKRKEIECASCSGVLDDDYYKKMAYEHLKAKNILIYHDHLDVDKNLLSRGMREYFSYSINKFSNNTMPKILIEFQNGKYASVE